MSQATGSFLASRFAVLVVVVLVTAGLYFDVLVWLVGKWSSDHDYSHGYVVPLFSAYIVWSKRPTQGAERPPDTLAGFSLGIALVLVGLGMRVTGLYMRFNTLEAISLLPFLMGVVVIALGGSSLRWTAPGILFLMFMIPMPGFLADKLGGFLQMVATHVSTFSLQTLGIPAFAEGNIINLSQGQIGVAEACSGLRMLYSFFALTTGACMLVDRSGIEKGLIALSAIPIAIIANCIRIIATGMAFEFFDRSTAEHLFHDVAGWLMMPLGFLILLFGLGVMDRLLLIEDRAMSPSR